MCIYILQSVQLDLAGSREGEEKHSNRDTISLPFYPPPQEKNPVRSCGKTEREKQLQIRPYSLDANPRAHHVPQQGNRSPKLLADGAYPLCNVDSFIPAEEVKVDAGAVHASFDQLRKPLVAGGCRTNRDYNLGAPTAMLEIEACVNVPAIAVACMIVEIRDG